MRPRGDIAYKPLGKPTHNRHNFFYRRRWTIFLTAFVFVMGFIYFSKSDNTEAGNNDDFVRHLPPGLENNDQKAADINANQEGNREAENANNDAKSAEDENREDNDVENDADKEDAEKAAAEKEEAEKEAEDKGDNDKEKDEQKEEKSPDEKEGGDGNGDDNKNAEIQDGERKPELVQPSIVIVTPPSIVAVPARFQNQTNQENNENKQIEAPIQESSNQTVHNDTGKAQEPGEAKQQPEQEQILPKAGDLGAVKAQPPEAVKAEGGEVQPTAAPANKTAEPQADSSQKVEPTVGNKTESQGQNSSVVRDVENRNKAENLQPALRKNETLPEGPELRNERVASHNDTISIIMEDGSEKNITNAEEITKTLLQSVLNITNAKVEPAVANKTESQGRNSSVIRELEHRNKTKNLQHTLRKNTTQLVEFELRNGMTNTTRRIRIRNQSNQTLSVRSDVQNGTTNYTGGMRVTNWNNETLSVRNELRNGTNRSTRRLRITNRSNETLSLGSELRNGTTNSTRRTPVWNRNNETLSVEPEVLNGTANSTRRIRFRNRSNVTLSGRLELQNSTTNSTRRNRFRNRNNETLSVGPELRNEHLGSPNDTISITMNDGSEKNMTDFKGSAKKLLQSALNITNKEDLTAKKNVTMFGINANVSKYSENQM